MSIGNTSVGPELRSGTPWTPPIELDPPLQGATAGCNLCRVGRFSVRLTLICGSLAVNHILESAAKFLFSITDYDRQYFQCREKLCSAIKISTQCMLRASLSPVPQYFPALHFMQLPKGGGGGKVPLGSLSLCLYGPCMPGKNERVIRDSRKKRQEATQYKDKMLCPGVSYVRRAVISRVVVSARDAQKPVMSSFSL